MLTDSQKLRAEMAAEREIDRSIAAMIADPASSWDDFCAGIGIAPWRVRKAIVGRVLYPAIREAVAEFIRTNFSRSVLNTEATITDISRRYHDGISAQARRAA